MYGTVHHPVQWYLNEVQFPKELRHGVEVTGGLGEFVTSMKCSSRRNCDPSSSPKLPPGKEPQ